MIPLKSLNDARLNTTLLPSKSPFHNCLRNAMIVSMIQSGRPKLVNIGTPLKKSLGILPWKDYPYTSFDMQSSASVKDLEMNFTRIGHRSHVSGDFPNPVDKWVQQDLQVYEDAFKPSTEGEHHDKPKVNSSEPQMMTSEPPPPPTRRARAVRGVSKSHSLDTTGTYNAVESSRESANHSEVQFQPDHDDQQPSRYVEAPKIEPPYMPSSADPKISVTSRDSAATRSTQPAAAAWENRIVPQVTGGLLVDVQGVKNVGPAPSKTFKNTMNQKKPQQRLTGSRTEMIKRFEKAAGQILRLALTQQGPITFELSIGRLLINPQLASPEFRKPFDLSEWQGTGKESIFTPQITTRSLDIEAILDIRQSQGRRLFGDEPYERKVTYVISCLTRNHDQVIIEVKDDGEFEVKGSRILAGALEWHYPLRSWDSRLQLMIREHRLSEYNSQIKEIVNRMSVEVTSDKKTINFSTTTIDQELKIQSVLIRRETTHSVVTYPDLSLYLEEVQDLGVQQVPGPRNYYEGSISLPTKTFSNGKLWWEVSIRSLKATQILKENDTLELGEAVKWKPESIIGAGIIRDLYSLGNEIVTKIDHVGFYNRAFKTNSDSRTGTKSQTNPSTDIEGTVGMSSIW